MDKFTPILVFCAVGGRSARAASALKDLGYTMAVNAGGRDGMMEAKAKKEAEPQIKVTIKKGIGFYIRTARNFLEGVESKDGTRKEAADSITVSGLGDAMHIVVAVATAVELAGVAIGC